MMSREQWLNALVAHARTIAGREYQLQNWFRADLKVGVNWVVELYNVLFDDLTFDLFFDTFSKGFTPRQKTAWVELRSSLEKYGQALPQFPDERAVFEDPEWQRIREVAAQFVREFEHDQSEHRQGCEA
jgi:hypothetical protein